MSWLNSIACFIIFTFVACFSALSAFASGVSAPKKISIEYLGKNPNLPTVGLVTTGGTIAEKVNSKTGKMLPSVTGHDLVSTLPCLLKYANIRLVHFSLIESSHMSIGLLANLSKVVNNLLLDQRIKGVVVVQGTDTMAEAAYFVDLTISNTKPVVFTGAMRTFSDISPDGPGNLCDALKQVSMKQPKNWGVTLTLNRLINDVREVRKIDTTNLQAFNSGRKGYLGQIANDRLYVYRDRKNHHFFNTPKKFPKVPLITTYVGDDGAFIRQAVRDGAQGIVIQAFGLGNVNLATSNAIQYALKRGVIVVITSQVQSGSVLPVYDDVGSATALQKQGAILAGDLLGSKARILLILAIANFGQNHNKLVQILKN